MIRTLSGFLGLSSDWDFLPWPHAAYAPAEADPRNDVLLGYSMGGRLALRELLARPFRAAVIVSAGLNVDDDREREERRLADEAWARRFETDPWDELMRAWDAQPVFGGHRMTRREADYDRSSLARELREHSPGVLEPLALRLSEIATPTLWVAGERDVRYTAVGRFAVERMPAAELWVCEGAGHRVPWERPEAFVGRLHRFLDLH